MTRKVYRSAMGKEVDLGALLLQNEQTRAVGNMNVNARGDLLDSANRVIDQKNRQVQRQYQRTVSNVTNNAVIHSSSAAAKQAASQTFTTEELQSFDDLLTPVVEPVTTTVEQDTAPVEQATIPVEEPIAQPAPVSDEAVAPGGGLAAAIARSRLIKQEKELTLREKARQQGLKKI